MRMMLRCGIVGTLAWSSQLYAQDNVENSGDFFATALPVAALTSTLIWKDDQQATQIVNDMLVIPLSDITHPYDAARFIHVLHMLYSLTESPLALWEHVRTLWERHSQDAIVVNVTAGLAYLLHNWMVDDQLEGLEQIPDMDRIEGMFRESLDLDPDRAKNFARAAIFFLAE